MRNTFIIAAVVAVLAAPAAAQQGPTVVRFAADSDTLSAETRNQLNAGVIGVVKAAPISIVLAGHADASEGEASYLVGLSQRRANNVRDYLVAGGVPAGWITTQAFGGSRPEVDGRSPRNRRVEVTFGPGSGW